ncbi:hypothetical protein [Thermanaeromonas toyohensis]|uniref:hypothetical protein n=1 Tax=Thermanaeromonas toyohensis TaxID=161154 RepID=UPI0012F5165B|nr:hypothetical protein [Thermanaeromonas toyohensis]
MRWRVRGACSDLVCGLWARLARVLGLGLVAGFCGRGAGPWGRPVGMAEEARPEQVTCPACAFVTTPTGAQWSGPTGQIYGWTYCTPMR